MANNATTYLADKLINHTLRNTAYTSPTTVYLSLHTSDPTKAGLHTAEVSGGSYARVAITFAAPSANAPYEETDNSADVNFTTASGSWGTITHIGIEDASSAGNMLFFGPLTASKTVGSGDTFSVPTGDLVVDLG